MEGIKRKNLEHAKLIVDSLGNLDFSDTADVEVQLDAVASALLDLRDIPKGKQKAKDLSEVLASFVEDELLDPNVVAIADEIDNLIRTKDYEGYSEGYVEEQLESLVSDLQDELLSLLEGLEAKAIE
jgi:hypothetical protein